VACSGNPRELLAEIRKMGYQECIRCKLNQPNLVVENVASEG
jgi:hypothetical protein